MEKEALRIAIIDDENTNIEKEKGFLTQFGSEKGYLFQIDSFTSGQAFLSNYKSLYDLVLLDVQMPGMNGIEVAKSLRGTDDKVAIIFVTNYVPFAPEGYQVQALDYILKPISYYDFVMKIKKALNAIHHEKELNQTEYISFQKKDGIVRIAFSEIRYSESVGHNVMFHTLDDEYMKYDSLKHIVADLPKERFLQINNSQVINMVYVTRIDKMNIYLGSDLFVISHPRKKDVMERLVSFFNLNS